jgi:hypothetical protein
MKSSTSKESCAIRTRIAAMAGRISQDPASPHTVSLTRTGM